jgi:hypothetical protein
LTDWQPFCPGCGFVERIDDDGTCASCGADTCPLEQLRAHLAARGLHVVSAADRAVLDAMGKVKQALLLSTVNAKNRCSDEERDVAAAELARREGVPDGGR